MTSHVDDEHFIAYLFTGDRDYDDSYPIAVIVAGLKTISKRHGEKMVVVEGEATGADTLAWSCANDENVEVLPFPVTREDWRRKGKGAGPQRNQQMLDEVPQIKTVWAFHDDLRSSKGTKDMCRRSLKAGKAVYLVQRLQPGDPRLAVRPVAKVEDDTRDRHKPDNPKTSTR